MNEQEIKLLKDLGDELVFLRKLVHYQDSRVEALEAFAVSKIADLEGADRAEAMATFRKMVRHVYDANIAKVEKENPHYAAVIDIRPSLDKKGQLKWYLPDDPDDE